MLAGQRLACIRGGRLVFRDLDFAVADGAMLLVRGPNGAGKSTLLRLAAGLLQPAGGRLLWDGADVAEAPEEHRARVAYVGHLDALKPALTARENLAFWARWQGGAGDDAVDAALAAFGLRHLAEVPARFLSAGERRRLNLARLPAGTARLWLLDEPTVALDQASVGRLVTVLRAHLADGGAVMAATHVDIDVPADVLTLASSRPLAA